LLLSLADPATRDSAAVVRVVDAPVVTDAREVAGYLHNGDPAGPHAAAAVLNRFDVVVIQHEYGIFGGPDGDEVLAVLDLLRVPVISVLHTVLARPTPHQRLVLERVAEASDAVVVMAEAARARLIDEYAVKPDKITMIPHGANRRRSHDHGRRAPRPLILTWGLLGPGKGIEWVIDGLRVLRRLAPLPEYVVAGQTHPRLRRRHGEAYRIHLRDRARARGVTGLVRFEGGYLDPALLDRLIHRADVIVLPYDSRDQVTSGVLVEALAAGRPVVATAFPHAVELLSGGAGTLVPQYDGDAIGAALHRVLTDPVHAQRMADEAERLAPGLMWPAIADQYRDLVATLLGSR